LATTAAASKPPGNFLQCRAARPAGYNASMKRLQFGLRDLMFAVTLVALAAGAVAYHRPKHPVVTLAAIVGWPFLCVAARIAFAGRARLLNALFVVLSGFLIEFLASWLNR
jgi:hypothetical protein